MKERPILFSAPMVRALRDGRKTQTRRIVNHGFANSSFDGWTPDNKAIFNHPSGQRGFYPCPYGQAGDLLWLRETWTGGWHDDTMQIVYAATGEERFVDANGEWNLSEYVLPRAASKPGNWVSPLFMPRWASRITLKITDVRVQRLQEISEQDAIAEGADPLFSDDEKAQRPEFNVPGWRNYLWHGFVGRGITSKQSDSWPHQYSGYDTARGSFSSLWESLNGFGAWDANPWIWALSFEAARTEGR